MNTVTWASFLVCAVFSSAVVYAERPEITDVCGSYAQESAENYQRCESTIRPCYSPQADDHAVVSCINNRMAVISGNTFPTIPVPPSQATGQQAGTSTADPQMDGLIADCDKKTKEAKNYCSDPISYSTDGAVGSTAANIAIQLGTTGAAIAKGGGGINDLCNLMMTTGTGMAGLNGTFAARCDSFIDDCATSCSKAVDAYKARIKSDPINEVAYKQKIDEINKDYGACNEQKRKVHQMGSQAAIQANGAMMGKLCAEASKAGVAGGPENQPPPFVPAGPDCNSPSQASNPLCRQIGGTPGGGGPGGGFTSPSGAGSGKDDGFDVGDIDTALTQGMKTGQTNGTKAENAGVPNGGGQMLGGDGGGGLGGGDEKGRGGQSAGHNADVLKGERAGGGYNAVAGGGFNSGSGWGGYGADTQERGQSGFDLRKYLPGQKNGPVRGPAGLNRGGGEIAPPHEDIFKKISDRVQVVCKTNRLMDCN